MDQETKLTSRRRLGAHGKMVRRRRIFAGLREGLSYDEIAAEEGVTATRIRQIVSEVLQKRVKGKPNATFAGRRRTQSQCIQR